MPLILSGTDGVSGNSGAIVSDTAKSATGTAVDFTDIPSWVKRITVMFSGISTNGTSQYLVQIGTSSSVENSGYAGSGDTWTSGVGVTLYGGTGFRLNNSAAAATAINGIATLVNITGNQWCFQFVGGNTNAAGLQLSAGAKTLSGTLDSIRVTTINGSDVFDAGTINILYE
jgi:hypothetical protein